MKGTKVVRLQEEVKVNDPIFLVGLPGVGHVGKLVAEHLIEELDAEKIIEIYSHHFPPQVLVDENSEIHVVNNEIYVCSTGKSDIVILVGDHQSSTGEGHYELCDLYLDIAEEFGAQRIYTLGGFPTGQLTYSEEVLGAVNNPELTDELKKAGVVFKENEPGGGIVGASGLILGLSKFRNIDAACLMGLTSGYLVDPKSAQSLLKVICSIFDIEIDEGPLEERAKEMEKIVARLKEVEQQQQGIPEAIRDEDLRYIG
ncbi:proteasome assembly chaperone family protein [Methanolobus halotolerans]|uniref:Proteasome assembly chaperone family protein n=1 Tax=Methanolobus halotolerans TaxID=2052935 RepID=A0A4E0R069_9EURY|nr:proteasome assembly chaperone family protein [Methanolobus halotolerans]TGC09676.1 proteasome assembly chaperone family protein [Methanolobus halotolerans]